MLVQLISKIDGVLFTNMQTIDQREIDIWYVMLSAGWRSQQSYNSNYEQKNKTTICRDFNSPNGCNRPSCMYKHCCSYHSNNRKVFAPHSLVDCMLAKNDQNKT